MRRPAPLIHVPASWLPRARAYAALVIAVYDAGGNAASRASCVHGSATRIDNWVYGRMAEIAVCIYLGVDPETLEWRKAVTDKGWDVKFCGMLIDVKGTATGTKLIWPARKRRYGSLADAFLLVSGPGPFSLDGWIMKPDFMACCQEANGEGRLDRGTIFLERDHESIQHVETLIGLLCRQLNGVPSGGWQRIVAKRNPEKLNYDSREIRAATPPHLP